jgi:hypothetical protein
MNGYPTAEEELKSMTNRFWDQVEATEKVAKERDEAKAILEASQTSQCLLVVRDKGTDHDSTLILKQNLEDAKAHVIRIESRAKRILGDSAECPFQMEIFHLLRIDNAR